jgi:transposase
MIKNIAGVDIGKEISYAYISSSDKYLKFNNNAKGITDFIKEIKKYGICDVVMEGTGGLQRLLVHCLQKEGLKAYVANPEAVWAYKKSVGKKAKTDRIDAKQIAEFGKVCTIYEAASLTEKDIELKELSARREQYVRILESEKKRLKQYHSDFVKKDIEDNIKCLEIRIKKIETSILNRIKQDKKKKELFELLKSVPCIGDVTALSLLIDLEELGTICPKKICSLVGVAPMNNESGKFIGTARIRGGRKNVRNKLYMATFVGIRFNPVIKEFYKRLRNNGKSYRQAIVACMRKLLIILNAMVKNGEKWNISKAV